MWVGCTWRGRNHTSRRPQEQPRDGSGVSPRWEPKTGALGQIDSGKEADWCQGVWPGRLTPECLRLVDIGRRTSGVWCVLWVSWSDLKATGLGWTVTTQALSRAYALWEERPLPCGRRRRHLCPRPRGLRRCPPVIVSARGAPRIRVSRGVRPGGASVGKQGSSSWSGEPVSHLSPSALAAGWGGGWGRVGQSFLQCSSVG